VGENDSSGGRVRPILLDDPAGKVFVVPPLMVASGKNAA
jgi:hypothetical protein